MTRLRSGQAVLELAVALFAIVAVLVGALSFGVISKAEVASMVEAQRNALENSSSAFSPVADVSPGADGIPLTPDDAAVRGSLAKTRFIASFALPSASKLGATSRSGDIAAAGSAFYDLAAGASGSATPAFGFARGEAAAEALLPPAAKPLLGLEEVHEVREEVWAVKPGGLR